MKICSFLRKQGVVSSQSSTQGVALGWVKLGFQPERNTGPIYNL
jgi:hypothetical protein